MRAMPLTIRPMPKTGKRAKSIVISVVDCCSSGLRELTVAPATPLTPPSLRWVNCANKQRMLERRKGMGYSGRMLLTTLRETIVIC